MPGWPQRRLCVPQRREFLSFPLEAFPESFGADLQHYAAAASGMDLIIEDHAAQAGAGFHLGRSPPPAAAASVQVKSGRTIQQITSLAALFDAPHLEKALQWFLAKDGQKPRRARVELIGMLIGMPSCTPRSSIRPMRPRRWRRSARSSTRSC